MGDTIENTWGISPEELETLRRAARYGSVRPHRVHPRDGAEKDEVVDSLTAKDLLWHQRHKRHTDYWTLSPWGRLAVISLADDQERVEVWPEIVAKPELANRPQLGQLVEDEIWRTLKPIEAWRYANRSLEFDSTMAGLVCGLVDALELARELKEK